MAYARAAALLVLAVVFVATADAYVLAINRGNKYQPRVYDTLRDEFSQGVLAAKRLAEVLDMTAKGTLDSITKDAGKKAAAKAKEAGGTGSALDKANKAIISEFAAWKKVAKGAGRKSAITDWVDKIITRRADFAAQAELLKAAAQEMQTAIDTASSSTTEDKKEKLKERTAKANTELKLLTDLAAVIAKTPDGNRCITKTGKWGLHGLWEGQAVRNGPPLCPAKPTDIVSALQSAGGTLHADIEAAWPGCRSMGDAEFWEHEYNKHGRFVTSLFPRTGDTTTAAARDSTRAYTYKSVSYANTIADYFKFTLAVKKQVESECDSLTDKVVWEPENHGQEPTLNIGGECRICLSDVDFTPITWVGNCDTKGPEATDTAGGCPSFFMESEQESEAERTEAEGEVGADLITEEDRTIAESSIADTEAAAQVEMDAIDAAFIEESENESTNIDA